MTTTYTFDNLKADVKKEAEALHIQCSWCGRHGDNVKVIGTSSKEEARQEAMKFFRNDEYGGCDDMGITLDDGRLITWGYEEPQPEDWQDHYVFYSCDANPVDQREWWEK